MDLSTLNRYRTQQAGAYHHGLLRSVDNPPEKHKNHSIFLLFREVIHKKSLCKITIGTCRHICQNVRKAL